MGEGGCVFGLRDRCPIAEQVFRALRRVRGGRRGQDELQLQPLPRSDVEKLAQEYLEAVKKYLPDIMESMFEKLGVTPEAAGYMGLLRVLWEFCSICPHRLQHHSAKATSITPPEVEPPWSSRQPT